MSAIRHADTICGWQENLGEDECPPSWMWHLDDELEFWFEEMDRKRKEKYGVSDEDETPDLMQNDLSKGMRGGRR